MKASLIFFYPLWQALQREDERNSSIREFTQPNINYFVFGAKQQVHRRAKFT